MSSTTTNLLGPQNNEVLNGSASVAQYRSPSQNNTLLPTNSSANSQPIHPAVFFYRPPSDFYHYRINCNEISYDTVVCLLKKLYNDQANIMQFKENEYIFFYRQERDNRFYQVSCEIVSPLLVNNCLSKNFLGVEFEQNMEQEHLAFNFDQKEFLEFHLKQYLSQYILN